MVEIPDGLRCLYSATLEARAGSYVLEVPRGEIEQGLIERGEAYRVGLFARTDAPSPPHASDGTPTEAASTHERSPPVEEGDVREVTIETLGEQGDGIAKLERGYVVIVPGTRPDDEVRVEITKVTPSVAFAEVQSEPEEEEAESAAAEGGSDPEPPPDDTLSERDTL